MERCHSALNCLNASLIEQAAIWLVAVANGCRNGLSDFAA